MSRGSHTVCYKILRADEHRTFREAGRFDGSPVDRADGFVHLSAPHQVRETAARHFAGEDGLVLLAVAAERLGEALVHEPSRGGDLFPHLYGPLLRHHVIDEAPLPLEDGRHAFPDDVP